MQPLFAVLHDPPETGKVKLIGVYSTQKLADAAIKLTRVLLGFVDDPDSFKIDRYDIDKDHWPRKFVRL